MNKLLSQHIRHVLIVDDQQHIHDTFGRIFTASKQLDNELSEFESLFLDVESSKKSDALESEPQYQLTHALSGEEGVRLAKQAYEDKQAFCVAFVDMRMPNGMDGLETCEALWQVDPKLQIIICTAYSDHTWDDVLNRLGYNDRLLLLKKPFERDEAKQLALALSEKHFIAQRQSQQVDELREEVRRRQLAEEELRLLAHRDALTSLPNRPFLIEHLDALINDSSDDGYHSALLFLDLDNFKIINDSLGHDAGDDLLNQVATRLKECVRHRDATGGRKARDKTVRLGGDEFVVLLEHLSEKDEALTVARRIVKRISEAFELGERLVNVGTSVGVAFVDPGVQDAHEALRNADTAMYRAKHSGKGQISVFDSTMHEAVVARHDLEFELRAALEEDAFEIRYQPIVDLNAVSVAGVEVLLRWRRKDGNVVSPMEFIPIAEEIGMISQLGEWVLEKSMREFGGMLGSLSKGVNRDVYLGVNVSRRQMGNARFASWLAEIVEQTGFKRELVKIEVTESGDPRHGDSSMDAMWELHSAGVGIHIDDFGKGQSSLMCFKSYPVETVKIDRCFTASIATDHGHAVITQAMIQLAKHLNAKIVCAGVESENQLQLIRQWGCDMAQGYLFSKALTIGELKSLLENPSQSDGIQLLQNAPVANLLPVAAPGMSIQLN